MMDLTLSLSNDEGRLVKSWIEDEEGRLADDMIAGIPTLDTDRSTVMYRLFRRMVDQIDAHALKVAQLEEEGRKRRRGGS
jgi:hypothetical protein